MVNEDTSSLAKILGVAAPSQCEVSSFNGGDEVVHRHTITGMDMICFGDPSPVSNGVFDDARLSPEGLLRTLARGALWEGFH